MSVVAYIPSPVGIGADFQLVISVLFFDDADPKNSGVNPTTPPVVILFATSYSYPVNLQGAALQAAVVADIRSKGDQLVAARAAAASASIAVPVGAEIAIGG